MCISQTDTHACAHTLTQTHFILSAVVELGAFAFKHDCFFSISLDITPEAHIFMGIFVLLLFLPYFLNKQLLDRPTPQRLLRFILWPVGLTSLILC